MQKSKISVKMYYNAMDGDRTEMIKNQQFANTFSKISQNS